MLTGSKPSACERQNVEQHTAMCGAYPWGVGGGMVRRIDGLLTQQDESAG